MLARVMPDEPATPHLVELWGSSSRRLATADKPDAPISEGGVPVG
jgi:hypothetical protein